MADKSRVHDQRYRCVSCNEVFTVKQGRKPRCPSCMSIHSVEPVQETSLGRVRLPSWWRWAGIGLGAVAGAGGGWLLYAHLSGGPAPTIEDPGKIGAVDPTRLSGWLNEQNLEPENVVDPFASGEALDAFVGKHHGLGMGVGRAESLYKAFLDMKGRGDFSAFVPRQPRKSPVLSAGEALDAVTGDGKPEMYSFELAVMLVKACRLAGLPAVVAEVLDYDGMDTPLDPSGNFGHFAAVVYHGDSYEGEFTLFDLHQGRTLEGASAKAVPLTDPQVVACMLGHEATRLIAIKFDAKNALVKIEDALTVYPDSPQLHTLRALVYVSSGGLDQGKEELEKAMQLREDAQRIVKWGALLLAEDEVDDAIAEIQRALDMEPDYAVGHASLGMAYLADDEEEEAERELARAAELDPGDPLIPIYEANYRMATGDVKGATKAAEIAWEKNFHDPQTGILLAAIYQQAGRPKEAREILQEIRSNEELPSEILAFIDSQLGGVTVDVDEEEDEEEGYEDDEEEDDAPHDKIGLDKPDLGKKPTGGLLTGGSGSGLSLSPGGGSGISLQKGGGLLSGGSSGSKSGSSASDDDEEDEE